MSADVLGVDIGGVIIDRINDGTDTSFFSDNYLNTTAVPEAFEALGRLADEKFGRRVFLVSKCGWRVQERTLHWLEHHDFYRSTGIALSHVHFCRERREKAGICQRLGITHFVDDRLEVLGSLTTVATRYLFRPNPNEMLQFLRFLDGVQEVGSWQEILAVELPQGGAS